MVKISKKSAAKNTEDVITKLTKINKKVTHKAKNKLKQVKKSVIKVNKVKAVKSVTSPLEVNKGCVLVRDDQIKKAIIALLNVFKVKRKENNPLFGEDEQKIFVQIVAVKVPRTKPRTIRVLLTNPVTVLNEICLIVPNLEKLRSKQIEKTIEHYEELLKQNSINNVKILPLYQLFTEYESYEMKGRLCEMYDLFLVDGRIAAKVMKFLGKRFIEKRKQPTPICLYKSNLKEEFDRCVRKASMNIHSRGDNFISQIGYDLMKQKELVQNISSFVNEIQKVFPGGSRNIKAINIKGGNTMAIPIYYSLAIKNHVPLPVEKPKRPKKYVSVTDELSTYNNSKITLHPDGTFKLERITVEGEMENKDDIDEEEDDIDGKEDVNDIDETKGNKPPIIRKNTKEETNNKKVKLTKGNKRNKKAAKKTKSEETNKLVNPVIAVESVNEKSKQLIKNEAKESKTDNDRVHNKKQKNTNKKSKKSIT